MGDNSGIEWTDASWNPIVGCSRVSPGCDNCYAISQAHRISAQHQGVADNGTEIDSVYLPPLTYRHTGKLDRPIPERTDWTGEIRVNRKAMDQPLRWKRPRRIFVNSMSDLFHHEVTDGTIVDVWNTMALAERHQYQILTKRSKRMRDFMVDFKANGWQKRRSDMVWVGPLHGALPNVWLGVSVESDSYKFRIDHLRETPAAVRWLSIEPLVAPLTLTSDDLAGIDWVVVGGESGPGARPMHPDWVRAIRDVCAETGTPFFFKQWGNWADDAAAYEAGWDWANGGGITMWPDGRIVDRPDQGTVLDSSETMVRLRSKKDAGALLDRRAHVAYPASTSGLGDTPSREGNKQ